MKPDFKEERPKKYTKKQIDPALNLLKDNFYKQVSEMKGISESTLLRTKKEKEKRGI
ncbi:resolvase [Bacillus cereus]|uniref:resolvase n=1 Tax=Bacillus cereus TaxID=1396 RepID=UPI002ABEC3F5|nr:resolvase [Bacillus cereus]MDZ4417036.1 resolvase [Bacillus cereus]